MDMKVFVDTDSDIRLARRVKRDITERGREIEGVLKQYNKFVKPAFDHYIAPTMSCADIIVPRGNNTRRFSLVVQCKFGQKCQNKHNLKHQQLFCVESNYMYNIYFD